MKDDRFSTQWIDLSSICLQVTDDQPSDSQKMGNCMVQARLQCGHFRALKWWQHFATHRIG